MDPLNYLTTYSTTFGAPETIFLIAHVALALAGIYYAFIATSSDKLRGESLRLLGYGLLALGIVGTLLAVLRLAVGGRSGEDFRRQCGASPEHEIRVTPSGNAD